MPGYRQHGKVWYYRYVDADGVKREKKGCTDKRETERIANGVVAEIARIKAGLADPKAIAYRNHESRPLAGHLDDWRSDMLSRGKSARHADEYHDRAGKLAAMARGVSIDVLDPGRKTDEKKRGERALVDALASTRLSDLVPDRIQAALGRLRDSGRSNQTANHYRAALRAFTRWAHDNGRLRDVPMRGVKGFNAEEDVRHARRSLSDDELSRLIRAAAVGPVRFGMSGPLRAMSYRLAAATGFRVAELRKLTPESFRLTGPEPTIMLRANSTKNKRAADQPIAAPLAHDLTVWLQGQPTGKPVLPLHHETAKAIRADLEAAGIPYATDDGVADFHSLRVYFVSALVRSGASIKEVQALARHAKPQTTLNHYAKVSIRDLRGAIESLPSPDLSRPEPEALAATGTDDHPPNLPHPVPTTGDSPGPSLSASVPGNENDPGGLAGVDRSQVGESDGFSPLLSLSVPDSAERGGFEPPIRFDTYNGLANRRFRPLSHLSGWGGARQGRLHLSVP